MTKREKQDIIQEAQFVNEFVAIEKQFYNGDEGRVLQYAFSQYDIIIRRKIRDHRASDTGLVVASALRLI